MFENFKFWSKSNENAESDSNLDKSLGKGEINSSSKDRLSADQEDAPPDNQSMDDDLVSNISMPIYSQVWGYLLNMDKEDIEKQYRNVTMRIMKDKQTVLDNKELLGHIITKEGFVWYRRKFDQSPFFYVTCWEKDDDIFYAAYPGFVNGFKFNSVVSKVLLPEPKGQTEMMLTINHQDMSFTFMCIETLFMGNYDLLQNAEKQQPIDFKIYGIGLNLEEIDASKHEHISAQTTFLMPAESAPPNVFAGVGIVEDIEEGLFMGEQVKVVTMKMVDTGEWNFTLPVIYHVSEMPQTIEVGRQLSYRFAAFGYRSELEQRL